MKLKKLNNDKDELEFNNKLAKIFILLGGGGLIIYTLFFLISLILLFFFFLIKFKFYLLIIIIFPLLCLILTKIGMIIEMNDKNSNKKYVL